MKLVENWKQAYRWFSVQALAILAALPLAWATLPPQIVGKVPESWWPWIILILAGGGLAGRLIDQNKGSA